MSLTEKIKEKLKNLDAKFYICENDGVISVSIIDAHYTDHFAIVDILIKELDLIFIEDDYIETPHLEESECFSIMHKFRVEDCDRTALAEIEFDSPVTARELHFETNHHKIMCIIGNDCSNRCFVAFPAWNLFAELSPDDVTYNAAQIIELFQQIPEYDVTDIYAPRSGAYKREIAGDLARTITPYLKEMAHPESHKESIRVSAITALDDFKLELLFSTGEKKIFDFNICLDLPCFQPLKTESIFRSVYLEYGVPRWCDGKIDISPDYLYAHGVNV